jgi:hypothetical protein
MFRCPTGFRSVRRDRGIVLLPDDGSAGAIRYDEDLVPRRPCPELLLDVDLPDGLTLDRGSVERLATAEGEHGVLARGTGGELPVSIGLVFLDDTYARWLGVGPAMARTVRELVVGTRAFLGHSRRRRCLYAPPCGWRPIASPRGTTWLPPGYPDHRSSITVLPALPIRARDELSQVVTLLGGTDGLQQDPVPTRTPRGLAGHRWRRLVSSSDGRAMEIQVVALTDGVHDYAARLTAPIGTVEDRALFEQTISSLEPPPRARPSEPDQTSAVAFWTT